MKTKLAVLTAILGLTACQTTTDPTTGKTTKTLTPAARTEITNLENVGIQALANAAVTAATNATTQYVSTGKVNTKQLAAAEISGFAANAQGYVGQVVPSSTLVSAIDNKTIATAVQAVLPATVAVTQVGVNALDAKASALYTPASPNVEKP